MEENEARDIIEQDLCEKLLGPGYAKDIIVCSEDCLDEIIPDSPRNAYRVGIIIPTSNEAQENDDSDNIVEGAEQREADLSNDEEQAKRLNENIGEPDDSDISSSSANINPMSSHIGLITCVPINENVDIDISYGTYEALPWEERVEQLKVKTGKFTNSIRAAINYFDEQNAQLDFRLRDVIRVDNDAETISFSAEMRQEWFQQNFSLRSPEYAVEYELIKVLFSKCFKRTHHAHTIQNVNCNNPNQNPIYEDDNVLVYIDCYEANRKRFLSVILRLKSDSSQAIYQPMVSVRGNLQSYTEPITSIEDDNENAINEFLYRNVNNYGKGINCAVNWDEDATRIFTTFTPTVDVKKFTNVAQNEANAFSEACTLRNLSIWSNINIIEALNAFVDGYETWHNTQSATAENINGFENEKRSIIGNQEVLLNRLRANVQYLNEHEDALNCFKIANTAMLMQMVVARHPLFRKNRDPQNYADEPTIYDDLTFFSEGRYVGEFDGRAFAEPAYYPFQLAFLLMNVKSTFDLEEPTRRLVDLIWFPTGGGKTEAYLALTALTIVARRHRGQDNGVSVIMRYTLRLLTTQQFERATYLICALEFLRRSDENQNLGLGNQTISIGLYVGSGVTPNSIADLGRGEYNNYFGNRRGRNAANLITRRENNPFPITYCPWCGSRLVSPNGANHGYAANGGISCLNQRCSFRGGLPLSYIDEQIYAQKPTLLFATVDKFAQLYSGQQYKLLHPDGNIDTPDLIIQDELHLLVGALGSIVGFYESIIEKLCSKGGRLPKIVAATATTRNTSELIKKLYNREAAVFPPQGLEYSDNYFSHVEENDSKRRHLGLISAECVSSNMAEIRLTSLLILSKVKVFKKYIEAMGLDWQKPEDVRKAFQDETLARELDNYWCTVLYFNSLKDLGRSRSRVSQEVFEGVRSHQYLYTIPNSLSFLRSDGRFYQRVLEFTSRVDSSRIKSMLTKAEVPVTLSPDTEDIRIDSNSVDLVFASNMISVGIDIARWNLLVMVGQPRSTSEYIQSSSRAARSTYGLVVNLMNPRRIRERSLFENYVPFHSTFYKGVEPLSVTPLTSATIKHNVLVNIAAIYRNCFMPGETDVNRIARAIINDLFGGRYGLEPGAFANMLLNQTETSVTTVLNGNFNNDAAQSLREIAPDSCISIDGVNYNYRR